MGASRSTCTSTPTSGYSRIPTDHYIEQTYHLSTPFTPSKKKNLFLIYLGAYIKNLGRSPLLVIFPQPVICQNPTFLLKASQICSLSTISLCLQNLDPDNLFLVSSVVFMPPLQAPSSCSPHCS